MNTPEPTQGHREAAKKFDADYFGSNCEGDQFAIALATFLAARDAAKDALIAELRKERDKWMNLECSNSVECPHIEKDIDLFQFVAEETKFVEELYNAQCIRSWKETQRAEQAEASSKDYHKKACDIADQRDRAEAALAERTKERDELKIIAEKCLDPEYMKSMAESVIVVATVKRLKESEAREKETHDKLLAEVQTSMIFQSELATLRQPVGSEEEQKALIRLESQGYVAEREILECSIRAKTAALKEAEDRLPEGMKDCFIVFKKCHVGHGWLTAKNWAQHDCPTCRATEAEAKIAAVLEDFKSDMEHRHDCLEHNTADCEVEGCEDPDECSLCLTKQRLAALEKKP